VLLAAIAPGARGYAEGTMGLAGALGESMAALGAHASTYGTVLGAGEEKNRIITAALETAWRKINQNSGGSGAYRNGWQKRHGGGGPWRTSGQAAEK